MRAPFRKVKVADFIGHEFIVFQGEKKHSLSILDILWLHWREFFELTTFAMGHLQ